MLGEWLITLQHRLVTALWEKQEFLQMAKAVSPGSQLCVCMYPVHVQPRSTHRQVYPSPFHDSPWLLCCSTRWTSGTGSTRPGKKWQLLLASCSDHKRWKRLPCVPKPASFKTPSVAGQELRGALLAAQLGTQLLSGHGPAPKPVASFCATSSSPLTLLLLLEYWPLSAKGPKHGKGPALHCPEVKGANCFFLEHAPNFTPFFPHKCGKQAATLCTKGYFHTCR